MLRRLFMGSAFLIVIEAGAIGPVAASVLVDVELVVAGDVSRSMDNDELRLQRDGFVAAFRAPEILSAIRSGATGRIAVTYVEWAGPSEQWIIVPWTILADRQGAEATTMGRGCVHGVPLSNDGGGSPTASLHSSTCGCLVCRRRPTSLVGTG